MMEDLSLNLFADAVFDYKDARYVIFGVPYDGTTSFCPGTRYGPAAIRKYSYNYESYMPDLDLELDTVPVADVGDIFPECLPDLVEEQVFRLAGKITGEGKIPVMLGGEHSVTAGAARAVSPDWFIVCDAHLDLREEYRGSRHNHACTTRRVFEDSTENIIIIGARSGTKDQYEFAESNSITVYSAEEIRRDGISHVLEEIDSVIGNDSVYLSIDADVIDSMIAPGVGTPEPFGITPLDLKEVIRKIAPKSSGFDYAEVCESDAGQAANLAAYMIREMIAGNHLALKRQEM